jgi:hypothetical protein
MGSMLFSSEALVEMVSFEKGYVPADSLSFFQNPVTNAKGEEVEISSIIIPGVEQKYIVCVSSTEL